MWIYGIGFVIDSINRKIDAHVLALKLPSKIEAVNW